MSLGHEANISGGFKIIVIVIGNVCRDNNAISRMFPDSMDKARLDLGVGFKVTRGLSQDKDMTWGS